MSRLKAGLFLGLTWCLLIFSACSVPDASRHFVENRAQSGQLLLKGPLAFMELEGDNTQLGSQHGQLCAAEQTDLEHSIDETLSHSRRQTRAKFTDLEALVPSRYRGELKALAATSGVSYAKLIRANVVPDVFCTAFAAKLNDSSRSGELVVGRNLDFHPADLLGPRTLVQFYKPANRYSFVSVSWPGYIAVVSGMNQHGLSAAVLMAPSIQAPGTAIGFRVREILETCKTVEDAKTLFHKTAVASDHLVMLADENSAAIVRQGDKDRLFTIEPLYTSNTVPNKVFGIATDDRTRCLSDVLHGGELTETTAWQALTACHIKGWCAQTMLFWPRSRLLTLARGTRSKPASKEDRYQLDLSTVFETEHWAPMNLQRLSAVKPLSHYTQTHYPGDAIGEIIAKKLNELSHEADAASDLKRHVKTLRYATLGKAVSKAEKSARLVIVQRVMKALRQEKIRLSSQSDQQKLENLYWAAHYLLKSAEDCDWPVNSKNAGEAHKIKQWANSQKKLLTGD